MRRGILATCLACFVLSLAALNSQGAVGAAAWGATAWEARQQRRGWAWLAAVLATAQGFVASIGLVTLWLSAIAPHKPAGMELHTARLCALLAACVAVLVMAVVEIWRARRVARQG